MRAYDAAMAGTIMVVEDERNIGRLVQTYLEREAGLELGADDYVVKPFSPRELTARVKAVLRRTSGPGAQDALTLGSVPASVEPPRRQQQ